LKTIDIGAPNHSSETEVFVSLRRKNGPRKESVRNDSDQIQDFKRPHCLTWPQLQRELEGRSDSLSRAPSPPRGNKGEKEHG